MTNPSLHAPSDRLWFLDWVRVGAFALLIPYHLGMFYVSWDWHVKSTYDGSAVEPLMLVTAPFRLALLFFVSGAATRFLADRTSAGGFARSRALRLLPPLLFGMFVICAPQAYFEGLAKDGLQPGFLDFLPRYWGFDHTLKHGFTWNHLWFVAYLLVYSLLLAVVLKPLRRLGDSSLFTTRLVIAVLPALVIGVGYALTRMWFSVTHALVNDWPNHVVYLPLFLLGFAMARSQQFWRAVESLRWPALACACVGYAVILWFFLQDGSGTPNPTFLFVLRMWRSAYAWMAILTVLGFARRYLNRPSAAVAWLNRGVFCFYIVHQTAIVLFGVALAPLKIGPVLEPVAILTLTVTSCLGIYALAERFGVAKLLLGLPPRASRPRRSPGFATS
ncbi:acyltransferase family protein [Roseiterribacter gracilis]|uniref:Acetyltransferase n=1 Tax=Roseiterribacter gracilis TaxID=2812848 RepID=A0A8S8XEQ5_9PROT|nr:acetyltransferase [Rhodospirillales bacterium TMPK1]